MARNRLLRTLTRWRPVALPVYFPITLLGLAWYRRTGKTPHLAYHGMRQLYCLTRGASNELLSRYAEAGHPAPHEGTIQGVLRAEGLPAAVDGLKRDGFYVFPDRLPDTVCDELVRFAKRQPARLLGKLEDAPARAVFDPAAPVAVKYDLAEEAVCQEAAVQSLLTDASVLALARAYLGGAVYNDMVAMWWSSAAAKQPSSEVAQLYHFDMDRLRFLKLFFYLTDVSPRTGPHCFVAGSHREKPAQLWDDRRFSDEEIARAYGESRLKEICGERGSIIAVDTSGFHKGKMLEEGHRLILQLEFTNSLFGQKFNRIAVKPDSPLAHAKRSGNRTFERFEPIAGG